MFMFFLRLYRKYQGALEILSVEDFTKRVLSSDNPSVVITEQRQVVASSEVPPGRPSIVATLVADQSQIIAYEYWLVATCTPERGRTFYFREAHRLAAYDSKEQCVLSIGVPDAFREFPKLRLHLPPRVGITYPHDLRFAW